MDQSGWKSRKISKTEHSRNKNVMINEWKYIKRQNKTSVHCTKLEVLLVKDEMRKIGLGGLAICNEGH